MVATRWRGARSWEGDCCGSGNSRPAATRQLLVQQYASGTSRVGSCANHPPPLSSRDAGAPGCRAAGCGGAARRTRADAWRSATGVGAGNRQVAGLCNLLPYAALRPHLTAAALQQVAAATTTPPRWPWAPTAASTLQASLARTRPAASPSPAPPSLPRRRSPASRAPMASCQRCATTRPAPARPQEPHGCKHAPPATQRHAAAGRPDPRLMPSLCSTTRTVTCCGSRCWEATAPTARRT